VSVPGLYPGEGHPWADYLHFRARLLFAWEAEGKSPQQMAQDLRVDAMQMRLILMTTDVRNLISAPTTIERLRARVAELEYLVNRLTPQLLGPSLDWKP
jgi:hypothetical protein